MPITCKIYLKDPYNFSFQTLLNLCQLKNIKLISGSTSASPSVVKIENKFFIKLFNSKPMKNKKYDAPIGSQSFIKSLQVIKIQD